MLLGMQQNRLPDPAERNSNLISVETLCPLKGNGIIMQTVERQDMIPTEGRLLCEKRISSRSPNPSGSALDQ